MNNTFNKANSTLDDLITNTLQSDSFDPSILPSDPIDIEKYDLSIAKVVSTIMLHAKKISKNKEKELSSLFYKRYHKLWDFPFSLSDTFVEFVFHLVSVMQVPADQAHVTAFVLSKLIGKSLRTYSEVIVLLKHGFSYGAFSLCRQIFEIAVYVLFIHKHGDEVALEFYNHSLNDIYNTDNYEWARKSGCFGEKGHISFYGIERESGINDSIGNDKRLFSALSKFTHASPQTILHEPGMGIHEISIGPTYHSIEEAHFVSANYLGISLLHINELLPNITLQRRLIFCLNWIRRMNEEYKKVSDTIASFG